MPEHNNYRFVTFRADIQLRVPWDTASDPEACADHFREQVMHQFTNPDAMDVWGIFLPTRARTVNQASELPR
jgi:hypothetical protein